MSGATRPPSASKPPLLLVIGLIEDYEHERQSLGEPISIEVAIPQLGAFCQGVGAIGDDPNDDRPYAERLREVTVGAFGQSDLSAVKRILFAHNVYESLASATIVAGDADHRRPANWSMLDGLLEAYASSTAAYQHEGRFVEIERRTP